MARRTDNDKNDNEQLTAEQEVALAERVAKGDMAARDEFVCKNQKLVRLIAYRYVNSCSGLTLDDLTQAGNIGLIHAVDKFDPAMGYRFSTYATWWIRQAITREIIDKDGIVHLPVHVYEKLRKIRRTIADIEQQTCCPATSAEVAAALGEPEEKISAYLEIIHAGASVSIDKPLGEDDGTALVDMLPDTSDTPQDVVDAIQVREEIERVLEHLQPREQAVLKMRFGFPDGTPRTLDEVGAVYGVTRERVRQIEAKAIRKLRKPGIIALLKDCIDD